MSELHNALVFLYAQGTLIAPALEGRPVEPHAYARQAMRAMRAYQAPEQSQATMFDEFRLTDAPCLTCPFCQGHGTVVVDVEDSDGRKSAYVEQCGACKGHGDITANAWFEDYVG